MRVPSIRVSMNKKMKKTIWFIVNPISGVRRKGDIPGLIHTHLNLGVFESMQYFS